MFEPFVAEVVRTERLTPHFIRVVLGGLEEFGAVGACFDLRIKLNVPSLGQTSIHIPDLAPGEDWREKRQWVDPDLRGVLRTYSVRWFRDGELAVDFVHHPDALGPASEWAARTQPGECIVVLGPRLGQDFSANVDFRPGDASHIVLCADESAVPAASRILGDLRDHGAPVTGRALLEVPTAEDILAVDAPDGVEVTWLPRDGAPAGSLFTRELLDSDAPPASAEGAASESPGAEVISGGSEETYYWIAGESGAVRNLRRALVNDLGVPKDAVAFIGYWRAAGR